MMRQRNIVILIFVVSLSLRLTLSIVNRQANDDHLEVINWIVDKQQIPDKEDCWECFQPKLFYLFNAAIIDVLDIQYKHSRIICVQLINFLFGFIILLFSWKFIKRQKVSPQIQLSAFSLVAFNPCLAGINVQATNDTLAILAGVLAIYYAALFFQNKLVTNGARMILFTVLVGIIKGSGLVVLIALLLILILKLFSTYTGEKKLIFRILFFLILTYLLIVPFAGGYYQNYIKYKAPFGINQTHSDPPPSFFDKTYINRPGITSIADGYFTFRYFDMIRQPYISDDPNNYPLHRTSLWSQLYGRTVFMHFDQFPGRWMSLDPKIIIPGRVLIILGIFPLLLFIRGFFNAIFLFMKAIWKRTFNYFSSHNDWIHLVFVSGFLLFMIKYTYGYRDFSTMKSIFVFPALLSFIIFFIRGFESIKSVFLVRSLLVVFLATALLNIYDISFLIVQFLK